MKKVDLSLSETFTNCGLLSAGIGIGVVLGWFLRSHLHKSLVTHFRRTSSSSSSVKMTEDVFNDEAMGIECKLVLVIRNDLKMGKGKAAAQCAHAAVMAYERAVHEPNILKLWKLSGQRKVVVKVDSEQQLEDVKRQAQSIGLITSLVRDAGHTQVIAGSKTVLGVGPAPSHLVDKVTGHLKLY